MNTGSSSFLEILAAPIDLIFHSSSHVFHITKTRNVYSAMTSFSYCSLPRIGEISIFPEFEEKQLLEKNFYHRSQELEVFYLCNNARVIEVLETINEDVKEMLLDLFHKKSRIQ